ncbi:MAG: hypothetical protein Q9162_003744 [Coniocarpon cinnabarinum]
MFKSKAKKIDELPERSQTPQPAKSKRRLFGRKKDEAEPVPNVDLTVALPPSDDFRTSLLMNSLSTRFSMLREQDDPNSMLGKANDDSVLHSHRKSRLGGFMGTGLSDIDEVASISGSIRPPFAASGRSASYTTDASIATADDDSSTNGSIMSRSRPGEGNMLFGGRQKIYKIPVGDAGAVSNLGGQEQRGMKGRALYEDDVHTSAFQKYREEEKRAERERRLEELERDMFNDDVANGMLNSPSLSAFDEKRGTTSSTGSGPSRMSGSTTATSIASHGPNSGVNAISPIANGPQSAGSGALARSNSRRLYDTNLDQNMYDQQSANLTRMTSMQRKTSLNAPASRQYLHGTRSATNLRERFGPPASSESSRAASPLPQHQNGEKLTTFDNSKSPTLGGHSPVSPVFNDPDNPLNQAVDVRDRGKATALGQFNRPKQFDEQQFLQRQQSLHQQNLQNQRSGTASPIHFSNRFGNDGRRPSGDRKPFFPPRYQHEEARSRAGSAQSDRSFVARPRAGTGRSDVRPTVDTRPRNGTYTNDPSRPSFEARSANRSGASSPAPHRVHGSTQQSPVSSGPTQAGRQGPLPRNGRAPVPQPISTRNAFDPVAQSSSATPIESPLLGRESPAGDSSAVDSPSMDPLAGASPKISLERGTEDDVPAPLLRSPPQLQDHPAFRTAKADTPPLSPFSPPAKDDRRKAMSPAAGVDTFKPPSSRDNEPALPQIGIDGAPDTPPTDGSSSPHQLNGLIRSHLREISSCSSVYPNQEDNHRRSQMLDQDSSTISKIINEDVNPWLAGGEPGPQTDDNPENIGVAVSGPSVPTQPPVHLAAKPRAGEVDGLMNNLSKQHSREISAETQRERQLFAEDLRTRQKAIQENMRLRNEFAPRSQSPSSSVKERQHMFEKPFAMLRKSSSREDIARKKAGLGISAPTPQMNGQGRNTPNGALRPGPPPPPNGRILHMRMPETPRHSEESTRGRSASQPRHPNAPSEPMPALPRRTPPQSGRTSTSTDGPSSRQSEAGSDIRRSDFPSAFQSANASARPSLETMRQRSDSSAMNRTAPPLPSLRATAPPNSARPPMAAMSSTSSNPSTTTVSPAPSGVNSPPLTSTSMSSPDLWGETNTSLAQIKHSNTAPVVPSTLPASTYSFPPRADKDRPAAVIRRAGRSPTINKNDISSPTLISSTSNFETVELEEKRAQLQARAFANISPQLNPPPNRSLPAIPQAAPSPTRRGFFGRKSNESGRVSGEDSSGDSAVTKKSKDSEEDEFMTRPGGGRLRIRKVSSEGGGLNHSRKFEAVSAGLVEDESDRIAGGMI